MKHNLIPKQKNGRHIFFTKPGTRQQKNQKGPGTHSNNCAHKNARPWPFWLWWGSFEDSLSECKGNEKITLSDTPFSSQLYKVSNSLEDSLLTLLFLSLSSFIFVISLLLTLYIFPDAPMNLRASIARSPSAPA